MTAKVLRFVRKQPAKTRHGFKGELDVAYWRLSLKVKEVLQDSGTAGVMALVTLTGDILSALGEQKGPESEEYVERMLEALCRKARAPFTSGEG